MSVLCAPPATKVMGIHVSKVTGIRAAKVTGIHAAKVTGIHATKVRGIHATDSSQISLSSDHSALLKMASCFKSKPLSRNELISTAYADLASGV